MRRRDAMVSVSDIARLAGVSKSTVSRYLNNGQVSLKTRQKIKKIIEETGYQPNVFAQSLKAQQTNFIGVVIPRFDSRSVNIALKAIDQTALAAGFQIFIVNSQLDPQRELDNLKLLQHLKVAGILFFATNVRKEITDWVEQTEIPVLFIGQEMIGHSYIIHNDFQAGKILATHLWQQGYRDILYISVSQSDKAVGIDRLNGFKSYLADKDVKLEILLSDFDQTHIKQVLRPQLNQLKGRVIVCATDSLAQAVIQLLKDHGYQVPTDVAVAGFGGYSALNLGQPTITSVAFGYEEIGIRAFHLIKELIQQPQSVKIELVPNHLTIGKST
ncbi:LacI family DNA-binding transcriptional regulator [Ignavigranum ruoffiae]|uniref:LacI family DNA-binding transcriptional regulator n=1 Tax=Ignavigranum ruoffiae TaxID=89093 RepID=UPI0024AE4CD1|nr:LacI family DNA-binding transcriptional regulator [Ignavigranum ruoffiae]